ncbi:CSD domain-containing protein [Durusdinium trenchii]|uniref:CSD domain-containing protein n=1 Tax=Durusdinium trenchii TaxID=1381693 RepID=A0ABP0KL07_9DINO
MVRRPTPTGEFFTAEFKTFNEQNGWGFVGCDELRARFGSDVFAHNRELVNVPVKAVGEVIYFELGMTEDGKPQVLNAQPAGAPIISVEPAAKKPRLEEAPASVEVEETPAAEEGEVAMTDAGPPTNPETTTGEAAGTSTADMAEGTAG